jgi:RNA polymerase sigma-70 factor (ECF subfamily)
VNDAAEHVYERLLVLRAQLGDETAFAELVERVSPRLRYFLVRIVGAHAAIDDLCQETWLAVWRGLPRLSAASAFRAWLYRIARDQALALLRRERRLPRSVAHGREAELVADEAEGEFSAEDVAALHRALDELPPEQREAIVLRFVEQMSYDEIAEVTQTALGTVRSRLFYAKRALRNQLEKHHAPE